MKFSVVNRDHHLGDKAFLVTVNCNIKTRQINYNTVFYVVEINWFKKRCNMRQWIIRFLVPISHSMKTSFFNFLQNFIWKVFVTDNVLSSIGAPELMEFQNKIYQLYFKQDQEAALNSVSDKMLNMGISIIEHSDLIVKTAPLNEDIRLGRFCFKDDDEDFFSDDELHQELYDDYISRCSQLTYEADRQAAKQRILERRFPKRIPKTFLMMQAPGVAEILNLIDYFIIITLCNFSYNFVIL